MWRWMCCKPVQMFTLFIRTQDLSCLQTCWKKSLCCQTKLGSAYPCTVKPSFWHQVVLKGKYSIYSLPKQGVQGLSCSKLRTPLWVSTHFYLFIILSWDGGFQCSDNCQTKRFFNDLKRFFGGGHCMACRILAPQPAIECLYIGRAKSEPLGH